LSLNGRRSGDVGVGVRSRGWLGGDKKHAGGDSCEVMHSRAEKRELV
jgi:hypothetical protein